MALILSNQYPNTTPPSAAYPQGSFKNETTPDALDGTPLEKAWLDDVQGLLQALLVASGVTPSGSADTVTAPQYLAGIFNLRYYDRVDYAVGTTVTGSDGNKYVCATANGPASTIVDPVGENPRTYWRTEAASRFDEDNPVGTIRMTSYAPHNFPAGTWTQTMIGRFPVGVDQSDPPISAPGNVGGAWGHTHQPGTLTAANHTLTEAQVPSVDVPITLPKGERAQGPVAAGDTLRESDVGQGFASFTAQTDGGGQPHAHNISGATALSGNAPPYQAAYFWRRTS